MTDATRQSYHHIRHDAAVDAGWSGRLRIVLGRGLTHEQFVYVDSDLLGPRRLVLTPAEAGIVGAALTTAARSASTDPLPNGRSAPDQSDVDTIRELLDLMANFTDNDQRARYMLSSNWLRDHGSAAAARLPPPVGDERDALGRDAAPTGRPGPDGA